MIRKSILVLLWFPITLVLILINLSLLASTSSYEHPGISAIQNGVDALQPIAASGATEQILGTHIVAGDARALLLQSFLERQNSPIAPYAELLVREADANNLDWRLVVAIAMCESGAGRRMPKDSYNAWGISIFTGQNNGKDFSDWPHAIGWVSRYLREKFFAHGITDLKDIGAIYAPPSVENGFSWTNCVQQFQDSIL
ncbi:hypothetical protein A2973_01085 [Candidatus Gottesmanbacteria bacterium RIFCSPLOWO2_01_FULL_49_10]|uniref:Mannosyl-glycoprotein endo-beta-N-acetylglucosamidase-like domain-containing protein n=1 Tax=Candidatus Gottesmanbacteria bacterium RIFCSPLOWO2_01_FULL_49_10 TaxID=1798396 RepID=A0A1F6AZY0_9BACT|nr:MAG: hypothetical protein A2973_01085 [Candidatus Gottesmanbacteria bacterium RIFCSPLOWO2_01_FULL_49_10]